MQTMVQRVELRQDEIELTLTRRGLRRGLLEGHQQTGARVRKPKAT